MPQLTPASFVSLPALALTALGLGLGLGACKSVSLNSDHCSNNEGDQYCADRFPDRPMCSSGYSSGCDVNFPTGCVAADELPADCHDPCGTLNAAECDGAVGSTTLEPTESSGDDPDTGTTTGGTDPDSSSSSDGPTLCESDGDCTNPAQPYCGDSGECAPCGDAPDTASADAACADADAGMPLCVADQGCVQCRGDQDDVCDEMLWVCNEAAFECAACVGHGECDVGGCEIAEGTCFPGTPRMPETVMLLVDGDGDGSEDFTDLQSAVDAVPDGGYGVITLSEVGAGGGTPYLPAGGLTIDAGKTIAIVAVDGEAPRVQGGGGPGVRVQGNETTVYIEGVAFRGGDQHGVRVDGGTAWLDRSAVVANDGGGILVENGGDATVRNCFVGGAGEFNTNAFEVAGGSATILYSTLVGPLVGPPDDALACAAGTSVTVRNSVLTSGVDDAEVNCPGVAVTYSATQTAIKGEGNVMLPAFDSGWFADSTDDFHLSGNPPPVSEVAQWQDGDPRVDIDGDARPGTDGAADYAGADFVP